MDEPPPYQDSDDEQEGARAGEPVKKASAFGKLAAIGGSAASAGGKLAFSGGKLALGAAATGGAMAAQAGASTARAIDDKFKLTSNPKFAAAAAGLSGAAAATSAAIAAEAPNVGARLVAAGESASAPFQGLMACESPEQALLELQNNPGLILTAAALANTVRHPSSAIYNGLLMAGATAAMSASGVGAKMEEMGNDLALGGAAAAMSQQLGADIDMDVAKGVLAGLTSDQKRELVSMMRQLKP